MTRTFNVALSGDFRQSQLSLFPARERRTKPFTSHARALSLLQFAIDHRLPLFEYCTSRLAKHQTSYLSTIMSPITPSEIRVHLRAPCPHFCFSFFLQSHARHAG